LTKIASEPVATAPGDPGCGVDEADRWRRKTDEVADAHERRRVERERIERVRFDLD
jgi:hypothetical protein